LDSIKEGEAGRLDNAYNSRRKGEGASSRKKKTEKKLQTLPKPIKASRDTKPQYLHSLSNKKGTERTNKKRGKLNNIRGEEDVIQNLSFKGHCVPHLIVERGEGRENEGLR